LLACAALGFSVASSAQDLAHGNLPEQAGALEPIAGADRLEGRLLAPCCWNQTLDIHTSEIALDLRKEIRRRLRAGETPDAIEADIRARYGDKILAVPVGSPLKKVAVAMSVGIVVAGAGAGWMLLRWRRRSQDARRDAKQRLAGKEGRDEYDARIDAELERLDG
jgi:cytochrome c-type biogenesis protein CcmH